MIRADEARRGRSRRVGDHAIDVSHAHATPRPAVLQSMTSASAKRHEGVPNVYQTPVRSSSVTAFPHSTGHAIPPSSSKSKVSKGSDKAVAATPEMTRSTLSARLSQFYAMKSDSTMDQKSVLPSKLNPDNLTDRCIIMTNSFNTEALSLPLSSAIEEQRATEARIARLLSQNKSSHVSSAHPAKNDNGRDASHSTVSRNLSETSTETISSAMVERRERLERLRVAAAEKERSAIKTSLSLAAEIEAELTREFLMDEKVNDVTDDAIEERVPPDSDPPQLAADNAGDSDAVYNINSNSTLIVTTIPTASIIASHPTDNNNDECGRGADDEVARGMDKLSLSTIAHPHISNSDHTPNTNNGSSNKISNNIINDTNVYSYEDEEDDDDAEFDTLFDSLLSQVIASQSAPVQESLSTFTEDISGVATEELPVVETLAVEPMGESSDDDDQGDDDGVARNSIHSGGIYDVVSAVMSQFSTSLFSSNRGDAASINHDVNGRGTDSDTHCVDAGADENKVDNLFESLMSRVVNRQKSVSEVVASEDGSTPNEFSSFFSQMTEKQSSIRDRKLAVKAENETRFETQIAKLMDEILPLSPSTVIAEAAAPPELPAVEASADEVCSEDVTETFFHVTDIENGKPVNANVDSAPASVDIDLSSSIFSRAKRTQDAISAALVESGVDFSIKYEEDGSAVMSEDAMKALLDHAWKAMEQMDRDFSNEISTDDHENEMNVEPMMTHEVAVNNCASVAAPSPFSVYFDESDNRIPWCHLKFIPEFHVSYLDLLVEASDVLGSVMSLLMDLVAYHPPLSCPPSSNAIASSSLGRWCAGVFSDDDSVRKSAIDLAALLLYRFPHHLTAESIVSPSLSLLGVDVSSIQRDIVDRQVDFIEAQLEMTSAYHDWDRDATCVARLFEAWDIALKLRLEEEVSRLCLVLLHALTAVNDKVTREGVVDTVDSMVCQLSCRLMCLRGNELMRCLQILSHVARTCSPHSSTLVVLGAAVDTVHRGSHLISNDSVRSSLQQLKQSCHLLSLENM